MKKMGILLLLFIFSVLILTKHQGVQENEDDFQLSVSRIQIGLGQKIDYLKYAECQNEDEVEYNAIDTSHYGTFHVVYQYHSCKATLTVDVVEMYENGIYNPETVQSDLVDDPDDITVLVNKLHAIPEDYQPDDLVNVVDSLQQLRKEAADAYQKFYQEAKKRNIEIYAISGYRTHDLQTTYWQNQVNVKGKEYASLYSAYPGRSEHQLGLALDVSYKITGDRLNESVAQSELGRFIVSDGYKYGFILRYPKGKESITNYGYEPWHIRYVGQELAQILHDRHQTLEEYYGEVAK